jgi:hypothetical protein
MTLRLPRYQILSRNTGELLAVVPGETHQEAWYAFKRRYRKQQQLPRHDFIVRKAVP